MCPSCFLKVRVLIFVKSNPIKRKMYRYQLDHISFPCWQDALPIQVVLQAASSCWTQKDLSWTPSHQRLQIHNTVSPCLLEVWWCKLAWNLCSQEETWEADRHLWFPNWKCSQEISIRLIFTSINTIERLFAHFFYVLPISLHFRLPGRGPFQCPKQTWRIFLVPCISILPQLSFVVNCQKKFKKKSEPPPTDIGLIVFWWYGR